MKVDGLSSEDTKRRDSFSSDHSVGMSSKTLPEQLVYAFTDYEDYVGSTYQKHVRLVKLRNVLQKALKDPPGLVYPSAATRQPSLTATPKGGFSGRFPDATPKSSSNGPPRDTISALSD